MESRDRLCEFYTNGALVDLPSEGDLKYLVDSKFEKICNELSKFEYAQKMSVENITGTFDTMLEKVREWKFETLKELEVQSSSQKVLLSNQKKALEDAKGVIFTALYSLQQLKEKKCSTDVEKDHVGKLCLQKFKPLIQDLYQMKDPSSNITEFIQNETFIKKFFSEEFRQKIGHFEAVSLNVREFHLISEGYLKLASTVSFKVTCSDLKIDLNRIIKYFRWKVEVNGKKVETKGQFLSKTFRFMFQITEMSKYTVSFFLLSEHVSGSPFSFIPFSHSSVDILMNNLDSATTSQISPTKEVNALYRVINKSTPEKVNSAPCNHSRWKNIPFPGMPLRRPFQKLAEDKAKVDVPEVANDELNFDIDFHPSLASTGTEQIAQKLNNLDIKNDDSIGLDRTADQTIKPGFKTILLDQFILKHTDDNHKESVLESQKKVNGSPPYIYTSEDGLVSPNHSKSPKLDRKFDDYKLNKELVECVRKRLVAKFECEFLSHPNVKLNQPMGIEQLKSKDIVVSNTLSNQMLLFSSDGRFLREFGSQSVLENPSSIVVLPDSKFAVKNSRDIVMFSPELLYLFSFGSDFLIRAVGLATDGRSNLLTVEMGVPNQMSIIVIDCTGKVLKRIPIHGLSDQQLWDSRPVFLSFWSSIIFVLDQGLNQIHLIDEENGTLLQSIGSSGSNDGEFDLPSAIAFDVEGFLIVADRKNNRIQVFTPSGGFLGILRIDRPLNEPTGLHLSFEGHLYVLNCIGNSLVKYKLKSE